MAATGKPLELAVPPKLPAVGRRLAMGGAALFGILGLAYFIDPLRCPWCPRCLWHALTGWYCPGCGMTRAAHELAHGHLQAALHLNALFVLALPVLLLTGLLDRRTILRWSSKPAVWLGLVVVVVVFGFIRNIPVSPFTELVP